MEKTTNTSLNFPPPVMSTQQLQTGPQQGAGQPGSCMFSCQVQQQVTIILPPQKIVLQQITIILLFLPENISCLRPWLQTTLKIDGDVMLRFFHIRPDMSKPQPSSGVRCSESILHTDNLSLF